MVKVHCTTMVLAGLNYLLEFNWCCLSSISSDKVPSSMSPKEAPLLICGRLTRLCGLPPTRLRQTSDPVFPGNANRTFHLPFASSTFDRAPDTHASRRQVFPSGHRDVPVRSTITARSASGVFSKLDHSVERDCVFNAPFPCFSCKEHH